MAQGYQTETVLCEMYDVTSGDNSSLLTNVTLGGITPQVSFGVNSKFHDYSAPMFIQSPVKLVNVTGFHIDFGTPSAYNYLVNLNHTPLSPYQVIGEKYYYDRTLDIGDEIEIDVLSNIAPTVKLSPWVATFDIAGPPNHIVISGGYSGEVANPLYYQQFISGDRCAYQYAIIYQTVVSSRSSVNVFKRSPTTQSSLPYPTFLAGDQYYYAVQEGDFDPDLFSADPTTDSRYTQAYGNIGQIDLNYQTYPAPPYPGNDIGDFYGKVYPQINAVLTGYTPWPAQHQVAVGGMRGTGTVYDNGEGISWSSVSGNPSTIPAGHYSYFSIYAQIPANKRTGIYANKLLAHYAFFYETSTLGTSATPPAVWMNGPDPFWKNSDYPNNAFVQVKGMFFNNMDTLAQRINWLYASGQGDYQFMYGLRAGASDNYNLVLENDAINDARLWSFYGWPSTTYTLNRKVTVNGYNYQGQGLLITANQGLPQVTTGPTYIPTGILYVKASKMLTGSSDIGLLYGNFLASNFKMDINGHEITPPVFNFIEDADGFQIETGAFKKPVLRYSITNGIYPSVSYDAFGQVQPLADPTRLITIPSNVLVSGKNDFTIAIKSRPFDGRTGKYATSSPYIDRSSAFFDFDLRYAIPPKVPDYLNTFTGTFYPNGGQYTIAVGDAQDNVDPHPITSCPSNVATPIAPYGRSVFSYCGFDANSALYIVRQSELENNFYKFSMPAFTSGSFANSFFSVGCLRGTTTTGGVKSSPSTDIDPQLILRDSSLGYAEQVYPYPYDSGHWNNNESVYNPTLDTQNKDPFLDFGKTYLEGQAYYRSYFFMDRSINNFADVFLNMGVLGKDIDIYINEQKLNLAPLQYASFPSQNITSDTNAWNQYLADNAIYFPSHRYHLNQYPYIYTYARQESLLQGQPAYHREVVHIPQEILTTGYNLLAIKISTVGYRGLNIPDGFFLDTAIHGILNGYRDSFTGLQDRQSGVAHISDGTGIFNYTGLPNLVRNLSLQEDEQFQKSNYAWSLNAEPDRSYISGYHTGKLVGKYTAALYEKAIVRRNYELDMTVYATSGLSGVTGRLLNQNEVTGSPIASTPNWFGEIDIDRVFSVPFTQDTQFFANNNAWLSYDVTNSNNQNIAGVNVSILDRFSGVGNTVLNSGEFYYPRILGYDTETITGYCQALKLVLATQATCDFNSPEEPVKVCLSGNVSSGRLQDAINTAKETAKALAGFVERDGTNRPNDIQDASVASGFVFYTGILEMSGAVSGDILIFDQYSIDYSGVYIQQYNRNPLYPPYHTQFSLDQYVDSYALAQAMNNRLANSGFYTWLPEQCMDTDLQGYYEYSPLLLATPINNHQVAFRTILQGSHPDINVITGAHTPPIEMANMFKYMLPRNVAIQGSTDRLHWSGLFTENNIDWVRALSGSFIDAPPIPLDDAATGAVPPSPEDTGLMFDESGIQTLLYSMTASGINACGDPYKVSFEFYEDKGPKPCPKETGDKENGDTSQDNSDGGGPNLDFLGVAKYWTTGWKFLPPQLSGAPTFDYYRVLFQDFYTTFEPRVPKYLDEFHILNVELFSIDNSIPILSGESCTIGSNYYAQIEGLTTGIISGKMSGYANDSTTGRFDFTTTLVTGVPNNGGQVKFQYSSGVPTTPFTGLGKQVITGSGYYYEIVEGFFYDSQNQSIEFSVPVSGSILGSGKLHGGPYNVIKSGIISSGIVQQHQYVQGPASTIVSGLIPDVTLPLTDVPGFGYTKVTVTGMVTQSGLLPIHLNVFDEPAQAYQYLVSGYQQASAYLTYNAPAVGDYIAINNIPITYDTGSGLAAPTFFDGIDTLVNILNSGSSVFQTTATKVADHLLRLTAVPLGTDGNNIALQSAGSDFRPRFDSNLLTGGATYYFGLEATEPFIGTLDSQLFATQFIVATASGDISGSLPFYSYTRTFTGLWDLVSGGLSFRDNDFISGDSYVHVDKHFNATPNYFSFDVNYISNPVESGLDLALLTITGRNFGTGLQLTLSGITS